MYLRINTISLDGHARGFKVSYVNIEFLYSFSWDLRGVVDSDFFFTDSIDFTNSWVDMDSVFSFDSAGINSIVKSNLILILNCKRCLLPIIELKLFKI